MAYFNIGDQRRAVVDKGKKVPDKEICGKCKHPRLNKGYLNLYEEFCCDKLYAKLKKQMKE